MKNLSVGILGFISLMATLLLSHAEGFAAATPQQQQRAQLQMQILRDQFTTAYIIVGAVLGGYIAVALRRHFDRSADTTTRAITYASVATGTSIALTPAALERYFQEPTHAEALAAGFIVAAIAWVAWEIAYLIGARLKKAAATKGWIGVKDELTGRGEPTPASKEETK